MVQTYRFVHPVLCVRLGAEESVWAGGGELSDSLGQEQEVVKEESVQLLVALGLEQFAAVEESSRPQAVGQRVENQILFTARKRFF